MITENDRGYDKRLVEVAHLFYEEQHSKSEIAHLHQISITHVNRLLKDAQRKGIVEILIKAPRFEDLEARLTRQFGLREARVIATGNDPDALRAELARAAAEYLQPDLKSGTRIGVASGRTLFETISCIKEEPRDIEVFPLNVLANGETIVKSISASTIATVLWFKSRPLAKAHRFELFFPLETIEEVRKAARRSLEHTEVEKLRSAISQLDICLLGISELRADSELVELSTTCGFGLARLRNKGVVGDVAFNAITADGGPLAIEAENLLFHIDLTTLKNLSRSRKRSVVLIGGGSSKFAAIKAALTGRVCNRIVTDSDTAEALLRELNPRDLSVGHSMPG